MNKVLVITYNFPPVKGGTFLRTLKYVKYLPTCGWNSIVLTARYNQSEGDVCDLSLMDEIPKGTEIFRERSSSPVDIYTYIFLRKKRGNTSSKDYNFLSQKDSEIKRLLKLLYHFITKFSVPDIYILWVPFAIIKAMKIIKNSDVDLIYSTSPPHSTHLVGYVVKRISRKPWVVDFRDSWTENPLFKSSNKIRARIERYMEQKVLASADKIICATGPMLNEFMDAYSSVSPDKFRTITNGFDPEDFEGIIVDKQVGKKFTITHTGSLGGRRTPEYFIKAIKSLIEEHKELKQKIQVLFVGGLDDINKSLIKILHLEGIIYTLGYVPHKQSIKYQLQSDVLLLVFHSSEGGKAVFTGKIFEYLASQKPILATIPESAARDLIVSENIGAVADPTDIHQIKEKIWVLYNLWKAGNLEIKTSPELLKKFDRREVTRQLAEVFDEITTISS